MWPPASTASRRPLLCALQPRESSSSLGSQTQLHSPRSRKLKHDKTPIKNMYGRCRSHSTEEQSRRDFQNSLVTGGEGQAREQIPGGRRRRLRRRGELKAVAECAGVRRFGRLDPQPPPAAPSGLRQDDDAGDRDAHDDPDTGVGGHRPAAALSARGGHGRAGGARGLGF
jgi:hypothetical protein